MDIRFKEWPLNFVYSIYGLYAINSKEYDTASVLLKILNEHGEELNR